MTKSVEQKITARASVDNANITVSVTFAEGSPTYAIFQVGDGNITIFGDSVSGESKVHLAFVGLEEVVKMYKNIIQEYEGTKV